ncbi:uncharacterized protein [Linepithema humile]|uniref:uncharacterized protein isoform X2 n=2 Tax=Linepithema humile TaxID=83485 RepID=UPI00351E7A1C
MALKLIKGIHTLITTENGMPVQQNGSFLVMDVRDNSILTVLDTETMREFYNLNPKNPKNICVDINKKLNCQQKDLRKNETITSDNFIKNIEDVTASSRASNKDADLKENETSHNFLQHIEDGTDSSKDSNKDTTTWEHSATWEHPTIMLLISLYKDHLTLFKNDKIRNEVVWKKIADCLKEKGYIYTAKQTENKWKNLRKSYIKTKDHNSKSGASFKKCKYYDEMEEIYGKSHIVQPVAIASNLSQKIVSISTDEEQRSDRENEDIVPPPKKTKMEKQLHVLTEYMDKNEKAKEKRHKERLEYQKEAIETYKQLMSKLLDKL